MKRSRIVVPWREGLHLRVAAKVVKRALSFKSSVSLKVDERMADAKSILAVLLLCATFGSVVVVEASGGDEEEALASITSVFEPGEIEDDEAVGLGNGDDELI